MRTTQVLLTPTRSLVVRIVMNSALALLPVEACLWSLRLQREPEALLNTNADSFGVVLVPLLVGVAVSLLLTNIAVARLLRSYPHQASLFPPLRLRPDLYVTEFLTLMAVGLLSAWGILSVVDRDFEFLPSILLLLYVAFALRAVTHARLA